MHAIIRRVRDCSPDGGPRTPGGECPVRGQNYLGDRLVATTSRDLLFGLLALQNGLVDQAQLVAAFQAWTRAKDRTLADHLRARGDLDGDRCVECVEAMVALHMKKHGDDARSEAWRRSPLGGPRLRVWNDSATRRSASLSPAWARSWKRNWPPPPPIPSVPRP